MTTNTSRWRLILREHIERSPDPSAEKKHIARVLDVSVRTVDRWIEIGSTTEPARTKIPLLEKIVPGREAEMALSLQREFSESFERSAIQGIVSNIPAAFLERVQKEVGTTARNLARGTIMNTVYRQMCTHFDPSGQGLLILFAQCKVEGNKVTHLEIADGHGTSQWQYQQIEHSFAFGDGALCAMAITRGDFVTCPQDIQVLHPAPILHANDIKSAVAYPVVRSGDVAGSLFVGSTQPEFFTAMHRELIERYSYSFALAFKDQDFYPIEQIDFRREIVRV